MPEVTPAPPRVRRIGHKGADAIAPGNTLESFAAALAAGVDMIEFDVLPENEDGSGRLILAHDYAHTAGAPLLEEGLELFAGAAYADVGLDVDLKLAGYERPVVEALRAHGLAERTIISTMEEESLPRVRAAGPEIELGWSVPRARRDYLANPATKLVAHAALWQMRRAIPKVAARRLAAGQIDAVMAHWALVSEAFAAAIAAAGGELYVWTVDDPARIARLESTPGVTGVITNDPRLFASAPA